MGSPGLPGQPEHDMELVRDEAQNLPLPPGFIQGKSFLNYSLKKGNYSFISLVFPSFLGMGRGFSLLLKAVKAAPWEPLLHHLLLFVLKATETAFVFPVCDAINPDWVTLPPRCPKPRGLGLVSGAARQV